MRRFLYLVTKKCRIYAACGVSQTPIVGKWKKGVRNIIFGFGNGKIVMKTAVLPFLFCIKKENYTLS